MKITTFLLILVLLFIPFQSAAAKKPVKNEEIVLTARQVHGANDIESAIISATERGTRPATVVLDGREGPFVLSGVDKSLNIFVSNLTLHGENNAQIVDCDDGLFFEGAPVQHILVENISFICKGDGVDARGAFEDVALRDVAIKADQNGIIVKGASSRWEITRVKIWSGLDGIRLTGVSDFSITKNEISSANSGIVILGGSGSMVKDNLVQAAKQGILLGQKTTQNIVQANKISGVSLAGIALEPDVTGNRIQANKVDCAQNTGCLSVDVSLLHFRVNKIGGNSRR